ncbi:DUF1800 domain-containing protein [Roseovarius sp. CAU 1744]|uniref:DUF1800 domain-containing protein n=1 Tax=Roseovarius sp. CAU 1744 TaxID=3140368 RepID=UPI00325C0B47
MFDSERAEIRFGCGLSPRIAPAGSVPKMLARLKGPDTAAARFAIPSLDQFRPEALKFARLRRAYFFADNPDEKAEARVEFRAGSRVMRHHAYRWFGQMILRRALGQDSMRERLAAFWADHFTAQGRDIVSHTVQAIYVEEAIRPHVSGRFADMLRAVMTHPLMLIYLDQNRSVGPNSRAAKRRPEKKRGLNENLARELLELHTLGVGGPYSQDDVRQLAELLTGLRYSLEKGFQFDPARAEPGAETVLGKIYGGDAPALSDIHAVLDDLAAHPATAAHLARKLAVHFVSDTPDPAMIAAMAARYQQTGGDLLEVYRAMLDHPSAWDFTHRNVKQPIDFISSSLRALDISPRHIQGARPGKILTNLVAPLTLMGQQWARAPGPDGWPEEDGQWITPQRLSARLQWAMGVPFLLRRVLPDPREFVDTALGRDAPEAVRFAAGAAENRAEGVGLVLGSPAFQRM